MLISVIMITYNHEKFIEEALLGVLKQKVDFDIEFIIANDCSNDKTHAIITKGIASNTNNNLLIKYINHTKNMGMMPNFSFALNQCKGQYIAMCEGDDYWIDPLKLQKQVDFMEANEDFNICFHRANIITNNKLQLHEIPNHVDFDNIKYVDLLKSFNFITTASVVLRMPENLVLPNWFNKVPWGDLALYKIIESKQKIKCLPEIMSVYRIHDKGMYSQFNKLQQNIQGLHFFKIIKPYLNNDQKKMSAKRRKEILNDVITKRAGRNLFKRIYFNIYYRIKY